MLELAPEDELGVEPAELPAELPAPADVDVSVAADDVELVEVEEEGAPDVEIAEALVT